MTLLTAAEFAAQWRCSTCTVHRLENAGRPAPARWRPQHLATTTFEIYFREFPP